MVRPDKTQRQSRPYDTVLCSGTLGKISFPEKIDAAAAAGFAGISVYFRESQRPEQVRRAVADAGLFLAELDGPMSWLPGSDGPPAPAPEAVVERAWELGARSITVIETSGVTPPIDIAVAAFASVCDLADDAGVLVHIEPFPWSGINDFGFAADIVARAGRSNGGVLLDTWHLFRGPDQGSLPARVDPRSIFGFQINDVRSVPSENLPYEAMHDRLLPGAGLAAAEIAKLVRSLYDRGCCAPLGVEVFSDELAQLPPRRIARRAYEALQSVFPEGRPDENPGPSSSHLSTG